MLTTPQCEILIRWDLDMITRQKMGCLTKRLYLLESLHAEQKQKSCDSTLLRTWNMHAAHLRSGDIGVEAAECELLLAVPHACHPFALPLQPRHAPERRARLSTALAAATAHCCTCAQSQVIRYKHQGLANARKEKAVSAQHNNIGNATSPTSPGFLSGTADHIANKQW